MSATPLFYRNELYQFWGFSRSPIPKGGLDTSGNSKPWKNHPACLASLPDSRGLMPSSALPGPRNAW